MSHGSPVCALCGDKQTVVACRLSGGARGHKAKAVETFGTTTAELWRLADGLTAGGCPQVALESTGEFWKPIWNPLAGRFELRLVNAQPVQRVPGRQPDGQDAAWLADRLPHGRLRASFIPPVDQRARRDLTRQRTHRGRARARVLNRLQTVLAGANLQLGAVVSQIDGAKRHFTTGQFLNDG